MADKIKVRFLKESHSPYGNFKKGSVTELEIEIAKIWIADEVIEAVEVQEEIKTAPSGKIEEPEKPVIEQEASEPKKRGRKPEPDTEMRRELQRLRAENEKLQKKLEQAELVIDVQKKLSQLLEPDESK